MEESAAAEIRRPCYAGLSSAKLPTSSNLRSALPERMSVVSQYSSRWPAHRRSQQTDAAARLNSSYLIEELSQPNTVNSWGRGIVTELGPDFVNSDEFVRAFGCDGAVLIRQEFATRDLNDDERREVKLQLVELGPECDHVQSKISTHRYLLGLLVPNSLIGAFTAQPREQKKPSSKVTLRNDSVIDIGKIAFAQTPDESWHLLVSCRCFMALAAKTSVKGKPRLRLRRTTLEELAHRYATHARRPGVMRFHEN